MTKNNKTITINIVEWVDPSTDTTLATLGTITEVQVEGRFASVLAVRELLENEYYHVEIDKEDVTIIADIIKDLDNGKYAELSQKMLVRYAANPNIFINTVFN